MLDWSNFRLRIILFLLFIIYPQITISQSNNEIKTISIIPKAMKLSGDVATKSNTVNYCTEPWIKNMPDGSIILGVNPISCNPDDWQGGSASLDIFLPDIYSPTVWVLSLSWPDRDGKGLHSPIVDRTARIIFDGRILWSKSTKFRSTYNDFYAAEHDPILTTIIVSGSSTHVLTLEGPRNTAWDLSEIELTPYPYPEKIRGIGYSPFRDCQMPGSKAEPTIEQVKEDLFRLSHTCNAIRTYGATGINGKIPAIAKSFGLKVYAGAWIDGDENDLGDDEKEIQALIHIANTVDVDGLIIGNEYYLRHQTPGSYATQQYTIPDSLHYFPASLHYLQQRIIQVKNGIKNKNIPLTTAEIDGFMFEWNGNTPLMSKYYKPIIDKIDFLMVHTYPFWNSMPIEGAAEFTIKHYLAMQDLIEKTYSEKNKRVIIGETGWPSAGRPQGQAIPNPENQKRYLREFLLLAEQFDVEYLYFDAFDELWKIEEPGHVGQNWGYSYTDRSAKYNFYGVLLPLVSFSEPYAPYKEYHPENRNIFPVYTEWPSEPISFLLTDQSINKLKDNNVDNDVIRQLDSIKNRKYASQKKFINSLETIIGKDQTHHYKNDILKFAIHNNHFIPSGWMGDTTAIQLSECNRSNPHNGEMATKIRCSFSRSDSWSGVYWLANGSWEGPGINIYEIIGLYPIRLTFWARGMKGGEVVKFKIGGAGPGDDSIRFPPETNWIPLNIEWTQYTINLTNQNLSNIVGGFCFVTSGEKNPGRDEINILIDDIKFESE
jgi:exo-beta-1,3-glucanase (GH17 family)